MLHAQTHNICFGGSIYLRYAQRAAIGYGNNPFALCSRVVQKKQQKLPQQQVRGRCHSSEGRVEPYTAVVSPG